MPEAVDDLLEQWRIHGGWPNIRRHDFQALVDEIERLRRLAAERATEIHPARWRAGADRGSRRPLVEDGCRRRPSGDGEAPQRPRDALRGPSGTNPARRRQRAGDLRKIEEVWTGVRWAITRTWCSYSLGGWPCIKEAGHDGDHYGGWGLM